MPIVRLTRDMAFPDPSRADANGLLAVGGDLSPERLLLAYSSGIFPWFERSQRPFWFSPDPRCVFEPGQVRVSRSLRKTIRQGDYLLTADLAFDEVVARCAAIHRPGQSDTWISPSFRQGYSELHRLGFAHSIEAWSLSESGDRVLAGGLYGVSLGAAFFGESMFASAPDASKVALVALSDALLDWHFEVLDAQVANDHVMSLGAELIPRQEFLARLKAALRRPTRRGPWTLPEQRPAGQGAESRDCIAAGSESDRTGRP